MSGRVANAKDYSSGQDTKNARTERNPSILSSYEMHIDTQYGPWQLRSVLELPSSVGLIPHTTPPLTRTLIRIKWRLWREQPWIQCKLRSSYRIFAELYNHGILELSSIMKLDEVRFQYTARVLTEAIPSPTSETSRMEMYLSNQPPVHITKWVLHLSHLLLPDQLV